MDSYIKGSVREIFYKTDKGFMVGIFKIRDTNDESLKDYLNKTITFCGSFHDINYDTEYKFYGNTTTHPKYGFQYKVTYYEKLVPEEKNSVISFLSSGMFPGIGIKTSTKIIERLGDNALDLILEDYSNLLLVPGIKIDKAKKIHDILYEEQISYKTILYLQEIGFSISISVKIYETYKEKTNDIISNNIYDIVSDISGISFNTVDEIALSLEMKLDDIRRINACILYSMNNLCYETGSTYLYINEIYHDVLNRLSIDIDIEDFKYYMVKLNEEKKVIILEDRYVLKKIYDIEVSIADRIINLTRIGNNKIKNIDKIISKIESDYNIKYNELQKKSIIDSMENNIEVITGGPGTGKTTIIKGILNAYQTINKLTDDGLKKEVVLVAPTGRAARRMCEATWYKAMTIHKFLGWDKETDTFELNEYNKSNAKMVIIDESSMIDIFLLNSLLAALSDSVKLIIVGDYNQLPSVLPGDVLKNIIDSDVIPTVRLNELYRQDKDSYIASFANDINSGNLDNTFTDKRNDYNFIEVPRLSITDMICKLSIKAIDKGYDYNKIQVLAPMYRGLNGIDNLNNKLQEIFNPKSDNKDEFIHGDTIYREGDKVLLTKNMNEFDISNGDIGIIDSIIKEKDGIKSIINFDGIIVEFDKKNFDDLKLGYAISIHKSQGSEFDIVIMPMDTSYKRMLYRKLIYTGVTRTKKSLMLVGESEAFIYGVSNIGEDRNTLLTELLKYKM